MVNSGAYGEDGLKPADTVHLEGGGILTQELVRALADKELTQVIAGAQDEQRARAEQRKHDTIAKIKRWQGLPASLYPSSKRGRLQKGKSHAIFDRARFISADSRSTRLELESGETSSDQCVRLLDATPF